MVELAELPLVLCSEALEIISLSGSYRLSSTTHKTLISKYKSYAPLHPTVSLNNFIEDELRKKQIDKEIIPHFVGANGQPRHPPTPEYARAILLVHKPWGSKNPPKYGRGESIHEFFKFIRSDSCPKSVVLEYARIKERTMKKKTFCEPVASDECYDQEEKSDMDEITRDLLNIVTNTTLSNDPFMSVDRHRFCRGLEYDWLHRIYPDVDHKLAGKTWLDCVIDEHKEEQEDKSGFKPFTITKKDKESGMISTMAIDIDMVQDDQLQIMTTILSKLKEWTECSKPNNKQAAEAFKPLRMTIRGSAGSGRSFFIKCLANTVRCIFNDKDTVQITAPTGAAAHNVGGETLHRKFAINPHKPSEGFSEKSKK